MESVWDLVAALSAPAVLRRRQVTITSDRRPLLHHSMTETKFHVGMTCEGCASAVKRILGKIDGVHNVQTDVASKTVLVDAESTISPQLMLEKLQKWGDASGKTVELVE